MRILKFLSETEILKGCIRLDRKAQKQLFELFFADMMAVCMRYAKDEDDGQEILQKGFIKVYKRVSTYTGVGSLKGWIYSIMVRTAIDHYRRQQRERKRIVPESEGWDEGSNAPIEAEIAAEDIMSVIQSLPHFQRTVFNLFAIEGFSHKEIADELGITEGTSKWYLCEARKALRKTLAPMYAEKLKEYAA